MTCWIAGWDASERVMGGAGEYALESGAGAREVVRGCVLEFDADTAAHRVSNGLFGLVVETVGDQAAMGRPQEGAHVNGC